LSGNASANTIHFFSKNDYFYFSFGKYKLKIRFVHLAVFHNFPDDIFLPNIADRDDKRPHDGKNYGAKNGSKNSLDI
jgi:hypothetical protein